MSTSPIAPIRVLRGNATPEELAGLLVVFAALRQTPDAPDPLPLAERRWCRPTSWHRPQPATAPFAVSWQRTSAAPHERTT